MYLGLDIGRQFVKAVVVDKNKLDTRIVKFGIRLVPDQNRAFDPDQITKPHRVMAVQELMKEMKINPKKVRNLVTSISGTNISVKQITTRDMPIDELVSAMTFEARKHIPMDGSDAVIDFQIFGPNPKEVDKIDVGLVACTKRVSTSHIEMLKEIGFKPGIIDADPIALTNAFTSEHDLTEDGAVVLLDIGSLSSSLVVWGRKDRYFTRDIPIGSHQFVTALAEKLDKGYLESQDDIMKNGVESFKDDSSAEIGNITVADRTVFDNLIEDVRRSLRYYAKTTNQSFFIKIFLSGGGAETKGLAEMIESKLNLETVIFNPFQSFSEHDDLDISNKSQFSVAVGLAIRGDLSN